jgi:hypothetical protein
MSSSLSSLEKEDYKSKAILFVVAGKRQIYFLCPALVGALVTYRLVGYITEEKEMN